MEVKLYVGNLSPTTTEDNLRTLFAQAGQVASVDLVKDRETGTFKGFAFVEIMMRGNYLRLIELAYDYVSAETEAQAKQVYDQAATVAAEITNFSIWLELLDYMEQWNRSGEHKAPMSRASALQFFSTRQTELNSAQIGNS